MFLDKLFIFWKRIQIYSFFPIIFYIHLLARITFTKMVSLRKKELDGSCTLITFIDLQVHGDRHDVQLYLF